MSNSNKRKKIVKILVTLVVVFVIGMIAFTTYSKKANEKAQAAMSSINAEAMRREAVVRQDLSSIIEATGTVEAEKVYSISLSTIQEISKVLVDVGDKVVKDQKLIEYDYLSSKEKLDKQLADANISLKSAQLDLKSFNVPKTANEISDLENEVVNAEKDLYQAQLDLDENNNKIEEAKRTINDAETAIANAQKDIEYAQTDIDTAQKDLDTAQKDLDRNKELLNIGAISQKEYDDVQKAYDDRQKAYNDSLKAYDDKVQIKKDRESSYDSAVRDLPQLEAKTKTYEYNIETAKYKIEKSKRDVQEAKNPKMTNEEKINYDKQKLAIESAQIKIEDIQSQIDDLTDFSLSPIDGVVIEKNVEDGDAVKESEVLMKVADTSKLKVRVKVSEYDASSIELGQTVNMTSNGIRDKVYTGKVTFIDPSAVKNGDETSVTVDAVIENVDSDLKLGFNMDIQIITANASNALVVPVTSILTDEQSQKYVFVVDDESKLKKSIIKTGIYGDMYVEALEGVTEGQEVLSTPNASMKEGDPVPVSNTDNKGGTENGDISESEVTAE